MSAMRECKGKRERCVSVSVSCEQRGDIRDRDQASITTHNALTLHSDQTKTPPLEALREASVHPSDLDIVRRAISRRVSPMREGEGVWECEL